MGIHYLAPSEICSQVVRGRAIRVHHREDDPIRNQAREVTFLAGFLVSHYMGHRIQDELRRKIGFSVQLTANDVSVRPGTSWASTKRRRKRPRVKPLCVRFTAGTAEI